MKKNKTTQPRIPNENRPGYKETKVGWIPEEWTFRRIDFFCKLRSGGTPSRTRSEYWNGIIPWATTSEVKNGTITETRENITEKGLQESSACLLDRGTLIIAMYGQGATRGRVAILGKPMAVNQACLAVYPEKNQADSPFMYHRLIFDYHRLRSYSQGGNQENLSSDLIGAIGIPLPPLPEQKKITEILSTWDEAIEQTANLISAKKQQKKALMQQLLTGRIRLPGFDGEWKRRPLSSVSERITDTIPNPESYPVLSITAATGFVSQKDKFSRIIAGKHLENYVLLKRGEFSYNKGNSYRYPQGCTYQLHEYDKGLVPSVFYSFRIDQKVMHDHFIKHFFLAGLHNEQLYRWVNTGVRNNGLLNLSATDFFNIRINSPVIAEQRAIAKVLTTADEEIVLLEAKHEQLKEQKKGLMQKLLTGEVRVKT
ncbi:MAG: restriction endonuclease subunit S [Kiritimatiellae bacterium]|nr:restriction endonuclease subunit S [Kiritimatiellia bacterium]